MPSLSEKAQSIKPSGIRAFFDLVIGAKDILSLGVGEPDFVTPWSIRETAIYSIEHGYTSYTSNKGLVELRKELSTYLRKKYDARYDHETEILITVGVSEAYDLALRSVVNPGDRVLIPQPCFVCYEPLVVMAGGTPVMFPLDEKNGFKISPELLQSELRKGVKAFVLNYPSNPTGMSYRPEEIKELVRIIEKHDVYVISDEIYDDLTYDYAHTSFSSFPSIKDKLIYLNGFSKAYAMTGWRVGYACANREIIEAMTKIHQYAIMCVSTASQYAAVDALRHGAPDILRMKKEYDTRRRFVVNRLNEIGLSCHLPEGAFYAFPSIVKTGYSSMDFSRKLLEQEKVAVVPGTAFGEQGEGCIRISYASGMDKLKEALVRIERFCRKKS
jgi:aminotransferase